MLELILDNIDLLKEIKRPITFKQTMYNDGFKDGLIKAINVLKDLHNID